MSSKLGLSCNCCSGGAKQRAPGSVQHSPKRNGPAVKLSDILTNRMKGPIGRRGLGVVLAAQKIVPKMARCWKTRNPAYPWLSIFLEPPSWCSGTRFPHHERSSTEPPFHLPVLPVTSHPICLYDTVTNDWWTGKQMMSTTAFPIQIHNKCCFVWLLQALGNGFHCR